MLAQRKGAVGEERVRQQRSIIPPGRSAGCQPSGTWHGARKITESFRFLVIITKLRAEPPTTTPQRAETVPALGAAAQRRALGGCRNRRRARRSWGMAAGRAPRHRPGQGWAGKGGIHGVVAGEE